MDKEKYISQEVESTFDSVNSIEKVQVSPFFKNKVLNKLYVKKEPEPLVISWFTPKYQLAALIFLFIFNTYALIQYNKQNYNDKITTFAQSYELTVSENESIFD